VPVGRRDSGSNGMNGANSPVECTGGGGAEYSGKPTYSADVTEASGAGHKNG